MSKPYHRSSSGWTDERRAKHSAAIRTWSPWKNSTGPRTEGGKSISRCNALKHGASSRPAKNFMRQLQSFHKFLNLCWQKRAALAEQQKQQNELLNIRSYTPSPSSPSSSRWRVRRTLAQTGSRNESRKSGSQQE
jgi:hypothetical protein